MLTENQKKLLSRAYGIVYLRKNEYELNLEIEKISQSQMCAEEKELRLDAINKVLAFFTQIKSQLKKH